MGETEVPKNEMLMKLFCDAKQKHVTGDTERPELEALL
jgi:hypothetical protein